MNNLIKEHTIITILLLIMQSALFAQCDQNDIGFLYVNVGVQNGECTGKVMLDWTEIDGAEFTGVYIGMDYFETSTDNGELAFEYTSPCDEDLCINVYNIDFDGDTCDIFEHCFASPLPVEFISFYGKLKDNEIQLLWDTASEENNKGFHVERSTDARDWSEIGFVEGRGTSSEINRYKFTDNEPIPGDNYYRLKQVDYDSRFEYSKIVVIKRYNVARVFPNPINKDSVKFLFEGRIYEIPVSDLPAGRHDLIRYVDGKEVLISFVKI